MKQPLLFALAGLLIATGLLFPACKEADPLPEPETRRIQLNVFNGIFTEKVNIYLESLGKTTVLATGLAQGKAWPEEGYATPLVRIPSVQDSVNPPTRLVIRGYASDSVLFASDLADLYETSRNSFFVVQEADSSLVKGRVTDSFTTPDHFSANLQFANLFPNTADSLISLVVVQPDTSFKLTGYSYNNFSLYKPIEARTCTFKAVNIDQDTIATLYNFTPAAKRTYTIFMIRDAAGQAQLIPLTRE